MVAGPALPNGFDCMCACSRGTDMYAVHWSTKILVSCLEYREVLIYVIINDAPYIFAELRSWKH